MGEALPTDPELPLPCAGCGYDLRGTESDVCPECGLAIDREALLEARIPWQQRKEIGRFRAFERTVWMAMWHPRQLAAQATRPVDYKSARRFQIICCVIAWLTFGPAIAVGMWNLRSDIVSAPPVGIAGMWMFGGTGGGAATSFTAILADASIVAAFLVGLFLWFLLGSGVASCFFHPKDRQRVLQERAVALSYYAAAPLARLPLAGIALIVSFLLVTLNTDRFGVPPKILTTSWAMAIVACVVLLIVMVDLLLIPLILLGRGLQASVGRIAACGLGVFVGWIVLFVLLVLGLPAFVLYVQVIYQATTRS